LQPGAQNRAAMNRQGADGGEALMEVGDTHGVRMLPLRRRR
jgi:hypothetical protein